MANTFTTNLRLMLQEQFGNYLQWGVFANNTFSAIDAAIAGMSTIDLSGGNATLTTNDNTPDEARSAILMVIGALPANREIVIPAVTKIYMVIDATTGGYTVTVKTSGGVGAVVAAGSASMVVCDGTDCYAQSVGTALNALALGGVAAASWARLDVRQVFTGAQDVGGVAAAYSSPLTLDASLSNVFTVGDLTGDLLLENPTNTQNGQTIIVHLEQDGTGGHTVTFGTNWLFPGGTASVNEDPGAKSTIYATVDADGFLRCAVANDYQAT